MSTDTHDQELINQVLAGQRRAARQFAQRLLMVIRPVAQQELRSWRHRRMGGRDVDDLCGEVFVALFAHDAKALRKWDLGRSSLTTIGRIYARSRIRDIGRRERRRLAIGGCPASLDDVAEPEARGQRPDEIVDARDSASAVVAAVRVAYPSTLGGQMIDLLLVQQITTSEAVRRAKRTRPQIFAWRCRLMRCAREKMANIRVQPH